ncbi:hypothetical protein PV08_08014 [Exophiala spinifera]|uniref:Alpha/beta hydrolase fold-3 domain-containing protein n=1 Tax=Exophiala spinifera TaxID=91928 RepID=A0A0D1ZIY1_9EURO|nr:uncharacterized protein PV08_08014 [Exophiala spinifera]KIW12827.1 hypothetical protein PV08_08014 [Exophiala spinifera]
MADFTDYGIPSTEWVAIAADLPSFDKSVSLESLKASTNRGREEAARKDLAPIASQVVLTNHTIPARDGHAIEARTYRPSSAPAEIQLPVYIHFHGGGFFFGTLDSEDAICARIAINTGVAVLNVNYRHTPEYGYPTAWNDAEDALDWTKAHAAEIGVRPDRIVVGGISAGAWLSAALTMKRSGAQSRSQALGGERVDIVGQVLMIPALAYAGQQCDHGSRTALLKSPEVSSYKQNEFAPILPVERINQFNSLLRVADPDPEDRRLNPGNARPEEVKLLPPTTLGVAGHDPLRDEGLLFGKMLADNGVPTNIHVFKGVPHGFRRFGDKLSASAAWDQVMEEGIAWSLSRPSASGVFNVQEH